MRGDIVYRERAKQLRSFSGLRFGNITPTDIDGLIEYKNKAYAIMETKMDGVEIPFGQMLALERMCDDLSKIKPTILIISRHFEPPEIDIDMASCEVEKYKFQKVWKVCENHTVKSLLDLFFAQVDRTEK